MTDALVLKLETSIDAVLAPARERMRQASESARALLPCETDWATSEELAELHRLQMELVPLRQAERAGARQRALARRQARRARRKVVRYKDRLDR